jgi:hypothetical protein
MENGGTVTETTSAAASILSAGLALFVRRGTTSLDRWMMVEVGEGCVAGLVTHMCYAISTKQMGFDL